MNNINMNPSSDQLSLCEILGLRKLVRAEIKEAVKDGDFKDFVRGAMKSTPTSDSSRLSNWQDPAKKLAKKVGKDVQGLTKSYVDYEQVTEEYSNAIYAKLNACLQRTTNLETLVSDLCEKGFEERVMQVLEKLKKKVANMPCLEAENAQLRKSTYMICDNDNVNQEHDDNKNVSRPNVSMIEAIDPNDRRELLEASTRSEEDFIIKLISLKFQSCIYNANSKYMSFSDAPISEASMAKIVEITPSKEEMLKESSSLKDHSCDNSCSTDRPMTEPLKANESEKLLKAIRGIEEILKESLNLNQSCTNKSDGSTNNTSSTVSSMSETSDPKLTRKQLELFAYAKEDKPEGSQKLLAAYPYDSQDSNEPISSKDTSYDCSTNDNYLHLSDLSTSVASKTKMYQKLVEVYSNRKEDSTNTISVQDHSWACKYGAYNPKLSQKPLDVYTKTEEDFNNGPVTLMNHSCVYKYNSDNKPIFEDSKTRESQKLVEEYVKVDKYLNKTPISPKDQSCAPKSSTKKSCLKAGIQYDFSGNSDEKPTKNVNNQISVYDREFKNRERKQFLTNLSVVEKSAYSMLLNYPESQNRPLKPSPNNEEALSNQKKEVSRDRDRNLVGYFIKENISKKQ